MYAGLAYIIHDKEYFDNNKRKVKAMLSGKNRWMNNICDASEEEWEQVIKDVFTATSEKKDVGEVRFLETVYQMKL